MEQRGVSPYTLYENGLTAIPSFEEYPGKSALSNLDFSQPSVPLSHLNSKLSNTALMYSPTL